MVKRTVLILIGFTAITGLFWIASAQSDKVTICHATSSEENPWVRIVVSENAIGGHFDNPGTPKAGHEDDILLQGEQDCPEQPDDEDTPEEPKDNGTGGGNTEDETPSDNVTNHPTTLPSVGPDGL